MGALEVHVTVDPRGDEGAIARLCAALGGRVVTIELPTEGAALVQSMVTFEADDGALAALRARVATLAAEHGVAVLRVKVETADRPGLSALYRESHALLRAPRGCFDAPGDELRAVAARHGARLSRRARREAGDEVERYLTRRDRGSFAEARARHEAWMGDLRAALARRPDITLVKVREEAVVWDDHEALDEGWR